MVASTVWLKFLKNVVAMAEIIPKKKVIAMAEIPNSLKRWSLWQKFLKKVVALAEIPKNGGRSGRNS